ncbi:hypothetical protein KORDIASMS9_00404 [Kordia sp. SMS9]|uniref:hypothetical protein n=1 Tax=Kordia sp. SMS9 TaxID=2282170 RepID=UPI000E0D1583|nr:hypothetical protein [Kordia sp. SMS9]AXG68212.1 hypothetical protein KORDIASMS9_00404 [Kordia sp. SMS9]
MIQVKGKNDLDTDLRLEALQALNKLSTQVLTRLEQLSKSQSALTYLKTESGFKTVKAFLGM